jgi:hypothetical protein
MHGGRRQGAGRPRQLPDSVRSQIGDACELRVHARAGASVYLNAFELAPSRMPSPEPPRNLEGRAASHCLTPSLRRNIQLGPSLAQVH